MKERIPYLMDDFLNEFKKKFNVEYSDLYIKRDKKAIQEIFKADHAYVKSSLYFEPKKLTLLPEGKENDETWKLDFENAKLLWESLSIPTSVALNEKMWVALENLYYLEYTLDQLNTVKDPNKIDARIIFTYNAKRSVAINSLSLLWWVVYYTIDVDNIDDPYHLTRFFFEYVPRSTKMLWLSSNVISSKKVALGILDGIKQLVNNKVIRGGRYAFTNSNKIINQVGGVIIMDMLSREDIKDIVIDNIPDMYQTELVN